MTSLKNNASIKVRLSKNCYRLLIRITKLLVALLTINKANLLQAHNKSLNL